MLPLADFVFLRQTFRCFGYRPCGGGCVIYLSGRGLILGNGTLRIDIGLNWSYITGAARGGGVTHGQTGQAYRLWIAPADVHCARAKCAFTYCARVGLGIRVAAAYGQPAAATIAEEWPAGVAPGD